jgi:hypothetical protein
MQRQIEQELNRVPSESVLAELVERLREAVEAQDAAAIEEWAGQVLRVRPAHPEALAGLQSLRDRKLIAQAREHYDAGQYRTAIDLLANRIPETSQHAAAAQELIRQAEEKRQIQTTLVQARERMEAGLYEPAETLVNEALRRDPESREALLLQNEILNRSGGFVRENARLGMGALAMLGLAGLLLHRTRAVWLAWFRPLALDRDRAHKPPVEGLHAREAEAGRTGAEAFGARRPEDARGEDIRIQPGARPKLARALRLEEARRMLERTEQLLRLSRQADRFQEHTAWFLELEAELSTISRRLSDTHGDPDRALSRLQRILAELRNVKFKAPPRDPPANGAGEEPSYYELLQVGTGATLTEIKSAYHRLLKEYHPDRHNQSEFSWIKQESERMTRRIGEAYEVLSDAAKREQYDRELNRRRRPAHGA